MLNTNDIQLIAQLAETMEAAIVKIEQSYTSQDHKTIAIAKREILETQNQIAKILK